MEALRGIVDEIWRYETDFKGQAWIDWVRDHAEVPVLTSCLYLSFVFYVPDLLKGSQPLKLRSAFAAWNLTLCAFSVVGSVHTLPTLLENLFKHGFLYTVCRDPEDWYLNGPTGLWVGLFIFSKIPELLDTAFLVMQQKRVIFLHWFHHATVMLYCWHAYHTRVAPGLWFAAMNFLVHSIMYLYYGAMACKLNWLATPFAPMITTVQILQMAVGSAVTVTSAIEHRRGGDAACKVDPANYKLGLTMYGSYLCLFSMLFLNKYFGAARKPGGAKTDKICGVEIGRGGPVDAAGRFEDFSKSSASGSSSPSGGLNRKKVS